MWYSILVSLAFTGRAVLGSPCKPSHSGSSVLASSVTSLTSEAYSFTIGLPTTSVEWPATSGSMSEEAKTDFTLSSSISIDSLDIAPSSIPGETFASASASSIQPSTTLSSIPTSLITSKFDEPTTSVLVSISETEILSLSSGPTSTSADVLLIESDTFTSTGYIVPMTSEMSLTSTTLITEAVETSTTVTVSTTDLTSSYAALSASDTTTILTTDSATLSATISGSPDTTSSSPATTSSAAPFRFKAISNGPFMPGTEMRAHYSSPWGWAIGDFTHQKPTIFTMESETGYLVSEGLRQCVAFDINNYVITIISCPEIMLPQHEYVTCDPVKADGDELRCGVAELKCILSGVGSGRLCERTGVRWTQIKARSWYTSHYFVGFVSPTTTANAGYNFGFVVKEV